MHLKREIKHHTPITKISRTRFFVLFKASAHSFVSYFQILESKSDMRFGLSAEEYELIEQTVVLPLAARGAVVWCFGSRARGTQTQFSDLDIMIDCSSDLNSIISEMSEKLIESNFPYKVELVELPWTALSTSVSILTKCQGFCRYADKDIEITDITRFFSVRASLNGENDPVGESL